MEKIEINLNDLMKSMSGGGIRDNFKQSRILPKDSRGIIICQEKQIKILIIKQQIISM